LITDSQLNGYSERFLDFVKNSSGNEIITLHKLSYIVREDSMIQMFFSKLNLYDIVRVIYYTYFLSKGVKQDDIFIFLDKIYIYILNDYDDKSYISVECSQCYGEGHYECLECDGTGNETCYTCDGNKSVNCEECSGSGKEQCYYCDGKGTETEEDDEGDDIEVECVHCDGDGTENCRDCSGKGNYECFNCDGDSNFTCEDCAGQGEYTCGYCDGNGTTGSGDLKYGIRRSINVTLGDGFLKYEGEFISLEQYNSIEEDAELIPFNIEVYTYYFNDNDVTVEERRESVDMEDDFVEVGECTKLENFSGRIDF
jgi:hypothetical protein